MTKFDAEPFTQYQLEAHKNDFRISDIPEVQMAFYALGVAEEGGEVAGKAKRYLRGDYDLEEFRRQVLIECGDTLWYMSQLLYMLGMDFEHVPVTNLEKIQKRKAAGTIKGTGDER